MPRRELRYEDLLNRRVYDARGNVVGRIEEAHLAQPAGPGRIASYDVGAFALFERLGGSGIGASVLRALGAAKRGGGYRVPAELLDLTNAAKPTLLCPVDQLEPLERR